MVLGVHSLPGIDIFEKLLFTVEFLPQLVAAFVILSTIVKPRWRIWLFLSIPFGIVGAAFLVGLHSHEDAWARGYNTSLASIRAAVEAYVETGEGNLEEIIESGKHAPTFGKEEMNYLLTDLMKQTFLHFDEHNEQNMPIAYNKGNDWFRATLGKSMVFTSAIYKTGNEPLDKAQEYKHDYVAQAIDLQPGEEVLDIGCGWGSLVKHFTEKYKAKVTGVTLSSEQQKYAQEMNKGNGAKVWLQDAMKMHLRNDLPAKGYDKITALEMAEHVGIRRYDEFLSLVNSMLKDDGVFYIQVAGLRRGWRYEDFVWGLFMGEHIFPGADASTPLGWVTTHLERNGFEIQRVNNLGTHYSRTITLWLEEWHAQKEAMIKKYGIKAYRRWEVFLTWSVRIARQGSSTVFMITCTKHGSEKARIEAQRRLVPVW